MIKLLGLMSTAAILLAAPVKIDWNRIIGELREWEKLGRYQSAPPTVPIRCWPGTVLHLARRRMVPGSPKGSRTPVIGMKTRCPNR